MCPGQLKSVKGEKGDDDDDDDEDDDDERGAELGRREHEAGLPLDKCPQIRISAEEAPPSTLWSYITIAMIFQRTKCSLEPRLPC